MFLSLFFYCQHFLVLVWLYSKGKSWRIFLGGHQEGGNSTHKYKIDIGLPTKYFFSLNFAVLNPCMCLERGVVGSYLLTLLNYIYRWFCIPNNVDISLQWWQDSQTSDKTYNAQTRSEFEGRVILNFLLEPFRTIIGLQLRPLEHLRVKRVPLSNFDLVWAFYFRKWFLFLSF